MLMIAFDATQAQLIDDIIDEAQQAAI